MGLVGLVLVVFLVFLITGTRGLFTNDVSIHTYLDDSAALTASSPVRLNGILIGKITKVDLSGESVPRRIVRVEMMVDEARLAQIPVDSVAGITSENVLGTKYINIRKGQSATMLTSGAEVPSLDTRDFPEVVSSGYTLLTSLQGMLKRIDTIIGQVEAGKGSIGKLLTDDELYNRLTSTVAEVQKVTSALNAGKGTIGRLLYDDALFEEVRSSAARVDNLLQELEEGRGTAGKLLKDPSLHDDIRKTIAEFRQLAADLNAGKGTAGKLLKSEEMHKQIVGTLGRLDALLDKVSSGQGTLGQLVVNPQMYESIDGVTRELNALLKDFRANPKKFLSIKLGLF